MLPASHTVDLLHAEGVAGHVCGVDEAGRGPLAGPVVAAAVILNPHMPVPGLRDSKQLTPSRRESLAKIIQQQAIAWAVAEATVEEIDRLNILQATLLAMQRAVAQLSPPPAYALIDGKDVPRLSVPARAIINGDAHVPAIAAASILAKTARDARMRAFDACYPGYGFAQHFGYPTAEHLAALRRLGACPLHRRSFAPVQAVLAAT
ncbi:MAG: ribonuclease HII [Sutterellaceae bacterium]|nr:ribonuclease HII [Burkholderiaceae bacterium]MCX7901075.1 ribonuclease HII [Burkholderiaceae bacterium]MDW8429657.1 ribonuclease HII [Sutterellaceae bacterium]